MRNNATGSAGFLAVGSLVLLVAGCGITPVVTGPLRTDSRTIDPGSATSARVEIDLGAGALSVRGGSSGLATTKFTYNVDSWKPAVDYSVEGTRGTLTVSHPRGPMVRASSGPVRRLEPVRKRRHQRRSRQDQHAAALRRGGGPRPRPVSAASPPPASPEPATPGRMRNTANRR